jgi:hypothetical protein
MPENGAMPDSLSSKLAPLELPDVDGNRLRLGLTWSEESAIVVFLRHWG